MRYRNKKSGDFDSAFEEEICQGLSQRSANFRYNRRIKGATTLAYQIPRKYFPDFIVNPGPNQTYIEVKGYFPAADRAKLVAVKEANPDVVINIIFQEDRWLTDKKKSRYSDWARRNGFPYSISSINSVWL